MHILDRTEIVAWDGRLDNREDLISRLKDSLRGDTSNAGVAGGDKNGLSLRGGLGKHRIQGAGEERRVDVAILIADADCAACVVGDRLLDRIL